MIGFNLDGTGMDTVQVFTYQEMTQYWDWTCPECETTFHELDNPARGDDKVDCPNCRKSFHAKVSVE